MSASGSGAGRPTEAADPAGSDLPAASRAADDNDSVSELEAQIGQTRQHLADTVDALSDKFDVKSRARAQVDQWRARVVDENGVPRTEIQIAVVALTAAAIVAVVIRSLRR